MSLEIKRTLANQILTEAMAVTSEECLWGLIELDKQQGSFFKHPIDCEASNLSDYVLVYNQSPQQQEKVETLQAKFLDQQQIIEVFEETKGVVGLRAYIMQGKMMVPQELVLLH